MNGSKYSVGLIGLGKIASCGWGKPGDPRAFSHAGGLLFSRKTELVAGADIAAAQVADFQRHWSGYFPHMRCYTSADAMLAAERPDIAGICVRTPLHHALAFQAMEAGSRAVFLEKPMTCSLAEADELLAVARARGIVLTVAYCRHWGPQVLNLERRVKQGLIGELLAIHGYVGGRVLHMGCHVTEMICQFAGYDAVAVTARGTWPESTPGLPAGHEPEPFLQSMTIEFASGLTAFHVGARSDIADFHVDLFGTRGMVRLPFHGRAVVLDAERRPVDPAAWSVPDDRSVYTVAYDQIADRLDGGPMPACTGEDAVRVHEIGMAAIESIVTGRRVELPLRNRLRRVYTVGK